MLAEHALLPTDPGSYRERCLGLAQQAPSMLTPAEAQRASDRATLRAVVEQAARLGVAPRWLAFGEAQAGADAAGLGQRLRTHRQPRVGQRALAKQAGVSIGMISTLEGAASGKPSPSIEMVRKLATALDVAPGWLAFGGELAPVAPPSPPEPPLSRGAVPLLPGGVIPVEDGQEFWEAWANERPTPYRSQAPLLHAPALPERPPPPQRLRFVTVNLPSPPDLTSGRRRRGHGGPWWEFHVAPCGTGVDLVKLKQAEIRELNTYLRTLLPAGWAVARWRFGPTPERVTLRALPTHLGGLSTELRERVLLEAQRLAPEPPPVALDPRALPSEHARVVIALARQAVELPQREESVRLKRWAGAFDPAPLRRCECGSLCHGTHLGAAQHAAHQILFRGAGGMRVYQCQCSSALHVARTSGARERRR